MSQARLRAVTRRASCLTDWAFPRIRSVGNMGHPVSIVVAAFRIAIVSSSNSVLIFTTTYYVINDYTLCRRMPKLGSFVTFLASHRVSPPSDW